jgi:predicted permease
LLTLAIGIGANTAIFSVIYSVLLKPLPFPDSDRLAAISVDAPGLKMTNMEASPSTYYLLRENSQTLEHPALWANDGMYITGAGEPERVPGIAATPSLFSALRVKPYAGRLFTDDDAVPKSAHTAVISYAYFQRRYGGNVQQALGQTIRIDGRTHTIIGVLPQSLIFFSPDPMIFVPLVFDRAEVHVGNFSFEGVVRLKPGVSFAQANADAARLFPLLTEKFRLPPGLSKKMLEDARLAPNLHPLKDRVVGNIGTMLWVLMATVGIVLFIACANVANLLLVRAEGRQQELAIRAALGASRGDLAKDLLAESLLLSLVGGVLGLGLAKVAQMALIAMAPPGLPRLNEIAMDAQVFGFALAISLMAGLLFGLVPVWKYASPQSSGVIRDGGRTASAGRERHRARATLVVAQVALAMVLLVGAGLMIRTFLALMQVDPGFKNPRQVLTASIGIPEGQIANNDKAIAAFQEILRRVGEIPGVEAVAMTTSVAMDGTSQNDPVFFEDKTYREGEIPAIRRFKFHTPGVFSTLGNPLLAGRDFTWTDVQNRAPVVIISEALAREQWGEPARAIGKRLRLNPKNDWREIVGVTGDERDRGLAEPASKTVHWPLAVKNFWDQPDSLRRYVRVVVRSPRVGTEAFTTQVRNAIWSVEPATPVANVRTMQNLMERSMARTSFTLTLLGIAGAMALLLGIIGIYGVISYSVSQRTREIGIRTALGASAGSIQTLFVRHAVLLAGLGVALGVGASFAVTRWMSTLLYGVSPNDWITLTAVAAVLTLAALVASYLPARRASGVAPVDALRS